MNSVEAVKAALSLRGQPPAYRYDLGLRIDVSSRFTMSGEVRMAASISRRRLTPKGNEGKAQHILTLTNDTAAEVLRDVADLLDPDDPEIESS